MPVRGLIGTIQRFLGGGTGRPGESDGTDCRDSSPDRSSAVGRSYGNQSRQSAEQADTTDRETRARTADQARAGSPRPDGGVAAGDATTAREYDSEAGAGAGDAVGGTTLLETLDAPGFVLTPEGTVAAWNDAVAEMTGVDADEAVGHEGAGNLFYPNRGEEKTLADYVCEHPTTAAEEHADVTSDGDAYTREEWICDADDTDRYFEHRATPIRDSDELEWVVQVSRERTAAMRRQEAVAHYVFELNQTVSSLNDGDLGARVAFEGDRDAVDDGLLAVEQHVNEMADQLQTHVERVQQTTDQLTTASQEAVRAVADITDNVDDQNALLAESVEEMQAFSATMEEVASTASEVDAAAADAREAATDGVAASTDAREATDGVVDIGAELVESVAELEERMDDIEAVTAVISEVAEQTNMLALNANIEAARAGEEGDGFAVVAEEVKNLADETHQHTEEITTSIQQLRAQTDETVEAVTASHDQIADAGDQIETALSAFEEIDAAVDRVADGIAEVSQATDDQAATVETLTATLEDAREYAEETEEAADRVADATDDQAQAVKELEARVGQLRS